MVTSSSSSVNDENIQKAGSITIQYPMLTKTNYSVWSLKMRVNLQAQGVWDANQQADVEERQDRMTLAAIYQAIPEDVLMMLAKKDSAKGASDFEVIQMKNDESVDDFAMRLNTIITGICSLGESIEDIIVVKKFLRAIPICFMRIVTSIDQFGDLRTMTVEEVMGRLKTHEERIRGYGVQGEPSLLLTHAEWSSQSKRAE
ncbi:inositol transporter 4-like protein isoform X2 [Tanacetum coccineum]